MLFNSYTFFVFFLVVLAGYYLARSWKMRKCILLVASYLFYAAWNPPFVVLLWFSTAVDWLASKGIHASSSQSRRRLFMGISLAANFGLLGYFKYGTFLAANFISLAHGLGLKFSLASPNIVLPVGISFYTFQTLSYTLDVYYRKIAPPKSFLDYALYVTFFPQLVAGPIMRAGDFLPQCSQPKAFHGKDLGWGLSLILLGLFEKIAIADGILAPVAEAVYDTVQQPDFVSAWCGTFAFAGQIFLDFAGYSLIAIGSALCLGFSVQDNFRCPYGAVGFSDFWGRWHMSLSSWLRDYLYIPLGGSRKGPIRTVTSLMVTMLLGGLWHGASWTFVAWGGLHGLYLVLQRGIARVVPARLRKWRVAQLPLALLTFLLICVTWVFFRAHSFSQAFGILAALLGAGPRKVDCLFGPESIVESLGVVSILFFVHWSTRETSLVSLASRIPWWARSLVLAVLVLGILGLSEEDHAFIYFQF